jgi:antitoxin component YwqK of YwqJK toxin-antitoxin module
MKRVLVLLLVSVISVSLMAAQFKSNRLGQNLGKASPDDSYVMKDYNGPEPVLPSEISAPSGKCIISSSVLWHDGAQLTRFDRFDYQTSYAICITDAESGEIERASYFENGRIVLLSVHSNGSIFSHKYIYDDSGELVQTVNLKDGILSSTDFYYRNSHSKLAMVRTVDVSSAVNDVLVSDSFIYENGKLIMDSVTLDLENSAVKAEKQEGLLVLSTSAPGGITTRTVMDEKGRTVKKDTLFNGSLVSSTDYSYDDKGILLQSSYTEGASTADTYYDANGKVIKEEEKTDGVLMVTNEYSGGEKHQTLYESGEPYAIVDYDEITGKIKKVTYW